MQFPKSASWAAISIFKCRDVLRNGLCHKIGNEWGTCMWEDPWFPKIPRFIPTSSNDTSSSDVYVACLVDHDSRQWDHVKSAYMSIIQPQLTGPNPLSIKEMRGLWNLKVHARFKNLLWKMVWRTLHVWLMAPWPLNMSNLSHIDIIEWVKCIIDPKMKLGIRDEESLHFQLYASIVCDRIWMQRNKARFGEDIGSVVDFARKIQNSFNEQKAAWEEVCGEKLELIESSWIPPPTGWVKLNFDAAIRENKTSVAMVGRDNRGRVVLDWIDILDTGSPLWSEAKAVYAAVNKVVEVGLKKVIIEGDAWNVIEPLKDKKSSSDWTIDRG
ncbi:uncharacterized protein LOC115951982 [Quercus lobata]|uniref:uncharacterized protein LOC115951982 n=1 Tax=Quercus lobata TaxID=97700 RepID=UPI001246F3BD|nr:uncharacterized protein LOC115951982 [Quercus lobata]